MLRVNILTPQVPWKRGFNDFYPLLKWKAQLRESGVTFKFFSDEYKLALRNCDILFLDYRYHKYKHDDWGVGSCMGIGIGVGVGRGIGSS